MDIQRLQKLAGINEMRVNKFLGASDFDYTNPKSPDRLLSFLKANYKKILLTIKNQMGEEDFEEITLITDINTAELDIDNYFNYNDERDEYPGGAEYNISQSQQARNNCNGITIYNIPPDIIDELYSGMLLKPIKGYLNLYYAVMWC